MHHPQQTDFNSPNTTSYFVNTMHTTQPYMAFTLQHDSENISNQQLHHHYQQQFFTNINYQQYNQLYSPFTDFSMHTGMVSALHNVPRNFTSVRENTLFHPSNAGLANTFEGSKQNITADERLLQQFCERTNNQSYATQQPVYDVDQKLYNDLSTSTSSPPPPPPPYPHENLEMSSQQCTYSRSLLDRLMDRPDVRLTKRSRIHLDDVELQQNKRSSSLLSSNCLIQDKQNNQQVLDRSLNLNNNTFQKLLQQNTVVQESFVDRNNSSVRECLSDDGNNFLVSAEEMERMSKSIMEDFDERSFDESFRDFLSNPLPDETTINSPTSVQSVRTNSSSGSLKELSVLQTLSLATISPENTTTISQRHNSFPENPDAVYFSSYQSQSPCPPHQSFNASPATTSSPTLSKRHSEFSAMDSLAPAFCSKTTNSQGGPHKDSLNAEKFASTLKELKPELSQRPSTSTDLPKEPLKCFKTKVGKIRKQTVNQKSRSSFLKPLLQSQSVETGVETKSKNTKTMRGVSESSDELEAGVETKSKNTKTLKGVSETSDKPKTGVEDGVQNSKGQHPTEQERPSRTDIHLYFQNKNFYRIRTKLRQVATLQLDIAQRYPKQQLTQKASKLFLNQLITDNVDNWVLNSVQEDTATDHIDLKNMTKRKIKIFNNIPAESIHEYSEMSDHPFKYLGGHGNRTGRPSEKLLDLLSKKTQ